MKRILTSLILLVSCVALSQAYTFDQYMNSLVKETVVSEIHVSRLMLIMVSPEILDKLPLLENVEQINSVSIYTASNADAIKRCNTTIANYFSSSEQANLSDNLLEIKDGRDYTVVYGVKNGLNTSAYSVVVLFTSDGSKGQVMVFQGNITPDVLYMIGKSVAK